MGSKLRVLEIQVEGLGGLLGSMLDLVGHKPGSRGAVATWKAFERAWVSSGAAGDPDLGPTWVQPEASWRQLGATVSST